MNTNLRNHLLYILTDYHANYIGLRTYDTAHKLSYVFLINKDDLAGFIESGTRLIEEDMGSFMNLTWESPAICRCVIYWLHPDAQNDITGYRQFFTIPISQLRRALTEQQVIGYHVTDNVLHQASLSFSEACHTRIRNMDKAERNALRKSLRDNFLWKGSIIRICCDIRSDFSFIEYTNNERGTCGGLCLSEEVIHGKDGNDYLGKHYRVHT